MTSGEKRERPRVLALFDVDGTLTEPRKVCRLHFPEIWI